MKLRFGRFLPIALVICLGAITEASHIFGGKETVSAETIPSQYSFEEMRSIWVDHFQGMFTDGLFSNRYPLPKIQERYNLESGIISKRYHANMQINLVTNYYAKSSCILCGNLLGTNGQPIVEIIVPKMIDIYKAGQLVNEPGWEEKVRYTAIVSFLHELDHLAYGKELEPNEHSLSPEALAEEEAKVWALTCEDTIRPLIEDYKIKLSDNECLFYNKWLESGHDGNSLKWHDFIGWAYGRVAK